MRSASWFGSKNPRASTITIAKATYTVGIKALFQP